MYVRLRVLLAIERRHDDGVPVLLFFWKNIAKIAASLSLLSQVYNLVVRFVPWQKIPVGLIFAPPLPIRRFLTHVEEDNQPLRVERAKS